MCKYACAYKFDLVLASLFSAKLHEGVFLNVRTLAWKL